MFGDRLSQLFGREWQRQLNACRMVYVVDESGPIRRFGFACGTLPGHVESGEERFLVEWHRDTDRVWYDILAFSRPNHLLTRLGYPLIRRSQRRFARDSAVSMVSAVVKNTKFGVFSCGTGWRVTFSAW